MHPVIRILAISAIFCNLVILTNSFWAPMNGIGLVVAVIYLVKTPETKFGEVLSSVLLTLFCIFGILVAIWCFPELLSGFYIKSN